MPLSSVDADATVWDLVLQHCSENPWSWPYDAQKLICTLLQVSKGLQQAVVTHFKGQMPVAATINNLQRAKSFARWLSNPCMASSGHIISKLRLYIECGDDSMQAEMLLAAALQSDAGLQDAAAAPGPAQGVAVPCHKLLVRYFSTYSPSIAITRSLAGTMTQLTSMKLSFAHSTCAWTQESMFELGKAIGSLSTLCDLRLVGSQHVTDQHRLFMGCDFLVIGLSTSTTLTNLDMQEVATTNYLPAQLRELTYKCFDIDHMDSAWSYSTYYDEHRPESPVFAGLTALTKLTFDSGTFVDYENNIVTRTIDIVSMPPNLLELYMPGISSNEALLQCKHLTRVVLQDCRLAARELQALTSLSDLRDVHLSSAPDGDDSDMPSWLWHEHAMDAAKVWKLLPLQSLKCPIDLREMIKHDAESDAIDLYASDSASPSSSDDHDHSMVDDYSERRSSNIMLLDELALQTGLTSLELDVYMQPPHVFEQLGLLQAPLQHLTNLRELYLRAAGPSYYPILPRDGLTLQALRSCPFDLAVRFKVGRKICKGHGLLCRVIAALPELTDIKLDWMPIAFARHLRMQLLADNSKAKLCINPKLKLDAD